MGLSLPTAWQNVPFPELPSTSEWLQVWFLPAASTVSTLGQGGEDESRGIVQIDINIPSGQGEAKALELSDRITSFFSAGRRFEYLTQPVFISQASSVSAGRMVDAWFRISVSIFWTARSVRIN